MFIKAPRRLTLSVLLAVSFTTLLLTPDTRAQYRDPFAVEEALLEELGKMRMPRFQDRQLNVIKRDFARYKDDLAFIEAKFQTSREKRVKGLMAIPETSKRYTDALWMLAHLSKKPENKVKFLSELRTVLQRRAANKTELRKAEEDQLRDLGLLLLRAMIDAGEEVPERLIGELINDKRGRMFWEAKIKLMQADKIKDRGGKKAEYEPYAKEGLKRIVESDLYWKRDYWMALAAVEAAHANVLLEKPKEAFDSIKHVYNDGFLGQIDEEIKRTTGSSAQSPLAGAYYYLADIYMLQAGAIRKDESKRDKLKVLMAKALNLYHKVNSEYGDSAYSIEALRKFERFRGLYEKLFDEKIKLPPNLKKLMDIGLVNYREERWEKAFDVFMKVAQYNLRGEHADDALFYGTACLYKQDRFLEAEALADLMADVLPKNKQTHDMLYKTAAILWNEGNKAKDQQLKSMFQRGSMRLFMRLFRLAPNHPGAAASAYRMAEAKWQEADTARDRKDEVLKNSNDQTERDAAIREMQQAYLDTVPFYDVLTENYRQTNYGAKAFYKLGWVYYIAEKPLEAAEKFLNYCELQPRAVTEKLRAKFLAADQLYRSGQIDEALVHFKELLVWLEGDKKSEAGFDLTRKRAKDTRRSVLALVPWCYDKKAAAKADKATRLREQADAIAVEIEQIKMAAEKAIEEAGAANDAAPDEEPGEEEEAAAKAPPAAEPEADPAPDAEATAEDADNNEADEEIADEDMRLPGDFGLNYITLMEVQVNVVKDLEDTTSFHPADGPQRVYFVQGQDMVTALGGKGLKIIKINDENYTWSVEPIACYRDGKLLGVYKFDAKSYTPAEKLAAGTAPASIELNPEELPTKLTTALRTNRLKVKEAQLRAEMASLEDEARELRNIALKGLEEFVQEYPKDPVYTAGSLLKIGVIYLERKDYDQAAKWLNRLTKDFPKSSAAEMALFSEFRAYLETNQRDKAKELVPKLKDKLAGNSFGNLLILAFKLFETNEKGELTALGPELAFAALKELIRRARDAGHPDHERAKRYLERALYLQSEALLMLERYEECIARADEVARENEKSPYFFDVWVVKGKAYRGQRKPEDALRCFNQVLTVVDKTRYPADYYRAVVESAVTLMAQNDKQSVQKALFRFQQVSDFAVAEGDKAEEITLLIQRAYVGQVKCYALLGETDKASGVQAKFLQRYPRSPFRPEVLKLPPAKF